MAAFHYPRVLLRPRQQRVWLAPRAITGPTSLLGTTQAVEMSGGGLWRITCQGIPLRTVEAIRAFRALTARAVGPVNPIAVPVYDWARRQGAAADLADFGDGSSYGDGSQTQTTAVAAELDAAAALRATSIDVVTIEGAAWGAGEFLTLPHGGDLGDRLHVVHRVTDLGGGVARLSIEPPLRGALPAGTRVEQELLACTMRLDTPDAGLTTVGTRDQVEDLAFVEYFP